MADCVVVLGRRGARVVESQHLEIEIIGVSQRRHVGKLPVRATARVN